MEQNGKKVEFNKTHLYVDVGGGSTEYSILRRGKKKISKSFKIGGVRLINGLVEETTWKEFKLWLKTNADELKKLDKEIVLNSIKLKWNLVENEFKDLFVNKLRLFFNYLEILKFY